MADQVRLSPTPEEALRRLERLADRLRVIGPRLAARTSEEAQAALVALRAGMQELADLTADLTPDPTEDLTEDPSVARTVPELGAHALADQALVLGHDLLAAAVTPADLTRAVAALDRIYALV